MSQSSRGRVHFVEGAGEGAGLFIKIFHPHGRDRLRATILGSDPQREYGALCFLRELGLPVVKPLALGIHRRCGLLSSAFLITEAVANSKSLDSYFAERKARMQLPNADPLRVALHGFAKDIARMHQSGFVDGDLHFRNVLIVEEGGALRWVFLDHPRARVLRVGSRRHARGVVHDLACLDKHAASFLRRTERMGFFKAYLGREKLTPEDRALLRSVVARRAKLLQKRAAKLQRSL